MKMIVMILRRPLPALVVAAALLLTAACGSGTTSPGAGGQPVQLEVVTAFYPFQFVTERVAGPHARVASLTQPGAEPHDLELTPRQVGSLSTADLVVYEKSFQPAVDEAVAQSGAADVLDTATVVPLQPLGDAGHEHEEGAAAEPAEGEHTADDGHDHGDLDPHVWLDPTNLATIATAVADRLAALDTAHAADYRANAAALRGELESLDGEFRAGLARCERTDFITTHAAFGYLARRYGLSQIAVSGLSPDAEPSPARVAQVQREAREHGVTTIFSETLVSPAMAEAIAGDLGLRTDVLDPVEGITDASRGSDYLAVMRSNLTALRQAGGCA